MSTEVQLAPILDLALQVVEGTEEIQMSLELDGIENRDCGHMTSGVRKWGDMADPVQARSMSTSASRGKSSLAVTAGPVADCENLKFHKSPDLSLTGSARRRVVMPFLD